MPLSTGGIDGCRLPKSDLPIDNGEVARAIRVAAVGRRDYSSVGSATGAERAAIMYTILGSSALAGVDPWAYTS